MTAPREVKLLARDAVMGKKMVCFCVGVWGVVECLFNLLYYVISATPRNYRSFRYKVVSVQTQEVKLHKNFVHFKHSLRVKEKNILGEYLRSLGVARGTIYTSNE